MIRITLSRQIRDRMKLPLRRAGLREIGGILMGQEIASGHFSVLDFSVDEASGANAHFVRDADHHRHALDAFFDRTGHNYRIPPPKAVCPDLLIGFKSMPYVMRYNHFPH